MKPLEQTQSLLFQSEMVKNSNDLLFHLLNRADTIFDHPQDIHSLAYNCDLNFRSEKYLSPILYILYFNEIKNLGFSGEQIIKLIQKADKQAQETSTESALIYVLNTNNNYLNQEGIRGVFKISPSYINYLVTYSDPIQLDKDGNNSLMCVLQFNRKHKLNLNNSDIKNLISKSDLSVKNKKNFNALHYLFEYNDEEDYCLDNETIFNVCLNSDLHLKNAKGETPAMVALDNILSLTLKPNQICDLVEKSNINTTDASGATLLINLMLARKIRPDILNDDQMLHFILKSDFTKSINGSSMIVLACLTVNEKDLQTILNFRDDININEKDNEGRTALCAAACYLPNLVMQLLEMGANVDDIREDNLLLNNKIPEHMKSMIFAYDEQKKLQTLNIKQTKTKTL